MISITLLIIHLPAIESNEVNSMKIYIGQKIAMTIEVETLLNFKR
jgi:hypothetical protein